MAGDRQVPEPPVKIMPLPKRCILAALAKSRVPIGGRAVARWRVAIGVAAAGARDADYLQGNAPRSRVDVMQRMPPPPLRLCVEYRAG